MQYQIKHPQENLKKSLTMNSMMNPMMNHPRKNDPKKNNQLNVSQQDDEWAVSWVGDGGVSGVSLSVVSSADDKNGEIAGNGGIWSDDGSLDGSNSISDA
ncbi:hypothetical protein Tco_0258828, partial [Tanacetum coccineum]